LALAIDGDCALEALHGGSWCRSSSHEEAEIERPAPLSTHHKLWMPEKPLQLVSQYIT